MAHGDGCWGRTIFLVEPNRGLNDVALIKSFVTSNIAGTIDLGNKYSDGPRPWNSPHI